jgi:biopolymer transport protein ExbD
LIPVCRGLKRGAKSSPGASRYQNKMRYPRNIKIFRGGVDAAPFAGLFFATVLFLVLLYSHVFFPGVPIALSDREGPPEASERTVAVLKDGSVRFLGEVMDFASFRSGLREGVQKGDLPRRVVLETEPGTEERLQKRVEDLLKDAGLSIKLPGTRMELPEDAGFVGAANPVIVVGLNLNGQIFFQHQLIQRAALQRRLAEIVEKWGGKVTLVLQADKQVPLEEIVGLSEVARKAGVHEMRLGTRPPL